jgi:hypothetical protein
MARASRSKRSLNSILETLDGDGAVEPRVAGFVHLTHSAGTDWRKNLIWPEFGRRWKAALGESKFSGSGRV